MYFLNAKPALAAISHPHSVLLPVSVALYAMTEAFLLKRMGQRCPKTRKKRSFSVACEGS